MPRMILATLTIWGSEPAHYLLLLPLILATARWSERE